MTLAQCRLLPVFHAVTHCICIRWQRQEDCLGNLEVFPRGKWRFQWTPVHAKRGQWRVNVSARTICGYIVRQNQREDGSEWRNKTALHAEVENTGEHSSNQGSPQATPQTRMLPGELLEPGLPNLEMPEPSDWGWTKETIGWQPMWTTLPEASKSCHELIHCRCVKGCTGRCKCVKAALKCTTLCYCSGDCYSNHAMNWSILSVQWHSILSFDTALLYCSLLLLIKNRICIRKRYSCGVNNYFWLVSTSTLTLTLA